MTKITNIDRFVGHCYPMVVYVPELFRYDFFQTAIIRHLAPKHENREKYTERNLEESEEF